MAEGTVGLFTLVGGLAGLGLLIWAKGTALRKGRPYQATIEFPLACGITVGTPVSNAIAFTVAVCRNSIASKVLQDQSLEQGPCGQSGIQLSKQHCTGLSEH